MMVFGHIEKWVVYRGMGGVYIPDSHQSLNVPLFSFLFHCKIENPCSPYSYTYIYNPHKNELFQQYSRPLAEP